MCRYTVTSLLGVTTGAAELTSDHTAGATLKLELLIGEGNEAVIQDKGVNFRL